VTHQTKETSPTRFTEAMVETFYAAFTKYMRGVDEPWLRERQMDGVRCGLTALTDSGSVILPREADDNSIEAGMEAFWDTWPAFRAWVKAQGDNRYPFTADGDLVTVPSEPFEAFYRAMRDAALGGKG
jgi:hypothetical protein